MLPWGIGSTLVWQFSEKCDPPPYTHTKQTRYKELPCNEQSLPECVPGETSLCAGEPATPPRQLLCRCALGSTVAPASFLAADEEIKV